MSVARPLALVLALLLAVPAATAYVQPVFYFLKDRPSPTDGVVPALPIPPIVPIPIPTVDPNAGILDPYTQSAHNAPNSTTAKLRMVTPGTDLAIPIQFVTPAGVEHPTRIKGPLFVGLWLGESSVAHGNLTATLYEIPASGMAVPLANASVALDANASKLPGPTTLIPANTTDPQAIAFYELGQVLPVLLHPPAIFILGPIDVPFAQDSSFAIGFRLTQGSSPAPLPTGAFASIEYDAINTPSFVYVPWYAPDPPRPTVTPRYTYSYSGTQSGHSSIPSSDQVISGDGKKSPGLEPVVLLAGLAAVAIAMRRRTR
jgi:hypothetical protein